MTRPGEQRRGPGDEVTRRHGSYHERQLMKGGRTPIHIMRYAPADFENDEAVRLATRRRNYTALAFYTAFINHSFMAGGDLPEDPERIAATIGWHLSDVRAALRYWLSEGKLACSGGRVFQKRVQREISQELAFRELQSERGKLGGRPAKADAKPPLSMVQSPPAPAPAPAPDARTSTAPANPLLAGRRVDMEREVLAMIREIADLTGDDPVDVIATASGYKGQQTTKLNPATMSDDRLANTWRDLKTDLTALRKKPWANRGNEARG